MRTGRSVLAMRLLDGFVPTGLRRKPLRSWRARQDSNSAFGACHYLGEKMVLRQAQFAANEAVRSTGLRAGARVGALFAAPGRSCRQASSCTMIRLRWPDRSASGIPRPRDKRPKIAFRPETVSAETETHPRMSANCGLLGRLREISRFERVRGGGRSRYRTGLQNGQFPLNGKIFGNSSKSDSDRLNGARVYAPVQLLCS